MLMDGPARNWTSSWKTAGTRAEHVGTFFKAHNRRNSVRNYAGK
jgi:hypothetical protein